MREYSAAVLGASGAVGREMLKLLEEYNVPIKRLRLLTGPNSAGKRMKFRGEAIETELAGEESFRDLDFVLGAAESSVSARFAPAIKKSGALYIDNSSHFRLSDEVPLVIPEINGEDACTHKGIISSPNCTTAISLMAVGGLLKLTGIKAIRACSYQAVSGAGLGGIEELKGQLKAAAEGRRGETKIFPLPIAMNVIPFIGRALPNGYTQEEMKLQNEGRRILHTPDFLASCCCVRVPVIRCHSIALSVRTEDKLSFEQAERAIDGFPGVRLFKPGEEREYPTPLDCENQDTVMVGRIREDLTDEKSLCLWCCGDQIRKGAAANAVQILKLFI